MFTPCNVYPVKSERYFTGACPACLLAKSDCIGGNRLDFLNRGQVIPLGLEVRLQLALSQEDLARELGVSYATINRWENGQAFQSGPCPAGCLLQAYDGDQKVKSSGMVKNGLNPIGIWIEIYSENQSMKFSE